MKPGMLPTMENGGSDTGALGNKGSGNGGSSNRGSLEERLERLEAIEEIKSLAARYCLALDMRAVDAWVGLFPADVRVGGGRTGRAALAEWFAETMGDKFTGTAHVTGNHIIEFDGIDRARGVVYSRNEHETGDQWVIMTMMYWDDYERINGRWHFRRRLPLYWYATDLNAPPVGNNKMRWPDEEPYEGAWHEFWPTYRQFWKARGGRDADMVEPVPVGEFLAYLRRDAGELPSVRVR